jgi:MtN3 and saliva related transmembrane protein
VNEEWLGGLAAILTTLSFAPQALLVIRTRNTAGISLTMYVMFTLGVACWGIYGVLKDSPSILLANIVTFALAAVILTFKIRETLSAARGGAKRVGQ